MNKFFGLLLASAALLLSGCFGGSDKVIRYYTLPIPEVRNASADPVFPYSVMVIPASVDPAYRRNNIVYRESPYDFMFYTYSVWAARPEFLVEQSVTSMLKSSALFNMRDADETVKPDLEFTIHLNAVEEVDKESSRYARLALTLTLRKTETEDFVWRKSYDESRAYDAKDMRNFAEAVYGLLQSFMDDAVLDIRRVLSFVPAENVVDGSAAAPSEAVAQEPPAPEMETVSEGE